MCDMVVCEAIDGSTVEVHRSRLRERVSVYAIAFDDRDRVLMNNLSTGGVFFPGGEKEPAESFEQALVREVTDEETGIHFCLLMPVGFEEAFFNIPSESEDEAVHATLIFYLVRPKDYEITGNGDDWPGGHSLPEWVDFEVALHGLKQRRMRNILMRAKVLWNNLLD